jgi:hypothetical protein
MTTNCDLDEVRHIAQQKFIEVVNSGAEFERDCYFWEHGDWSVDLDLYPDGEHFLYISLNRVEVFCGWLKAGDNALLTAAKTAVRRAKARAETEQREAACKALQGALKRVATTLPPPTYTEHTEPYSASTGHSGRRHPWWQFWRGL